MVLAVIGSAARQDLVPLPALHRSLVSRVLWKGRMMKVKDIQIGMRFGKLLVLRESDKLKSPAVYCECDCGKFVDITKRTLLQPNKSEAPKSCGCALTSISTKAPTLVGQVLGRLTVVEELAPRFYNGKRRDMFRCLCSCGNEAVVEGTKLRSKARPTRSCGCLNKEAARLRRRYLPGHRFGRLVILRRVPGKNPKNPAAVCLCDCGNQVTVPIPQLSYGSTKSCGCLHRELMSGDTHPNWNPDRTAEDRLKVRYDLGNEYNKLRFAVYERDNRTCVACGRKANRHRGISIAAHHLHPWHFYPKDRYKMFNIVTLCRECHSELHESAGGMRNDCAKISVPWIRNKRKETGFGKL